MLSYLYRTLTDIGAPFISLYLLKRRSEGREDQIRFPERFGYAARVSTKPSGYSFLPELNACKADQISIETAQPKLDCAILAKLPDKHIILGVLDLGDMNVESAETVAARVRRALPYVSPDRVILAPDCGMKYLPRDVAFAKLQAMVEGTRQVRRELGGE